MSFKMKVSSEMNPDEREREKKLCELGFHISGYNDIILDVFRLK